MPNNPNSQTTPLSELRDLRPLGSLPLHGGCPCRHVSYTLSSKPMIVHACHCTYCQRETGSAFALNAVYEPNLMHVSFSTGETSSAAESRLLTKTIPSSWGGTNGQTLVRCPECFGVLWSNYKKSKGLRMVRVGTIDGVLDGEGKYVPAGGLKPDAHVFAGQGSNGHSWFVWDEGTKVFPGNGVKSEYWSEEGLERLARFLKDG